MKTYEKRRLRLVVSLLLAVHRGDHLGKRQFVEAVNVVPGWRMQKAYGQKMFGDNRKRYDIWSPEDFNESVPWAVLPCRHAGMLAEDAHTVISGQWASEAETWVVLQHDDEAISNAIFTVMVAREKHANKDNPEHIVDEDVWREYADQTTKEWVG